jgi:hypothetical protein
MRTEQDMCADCGGFCCLYKLLGYPKTEEGTKEWKFLETRSRGSFEYGDKKKRWFVLDAPCPHCKDGRCDIYKDRPEICREQPIPEDYPKVWDVKCEVLRNRRK